MDFKKSRMDAVKISACFAVYNERRAVEKCWPENKDATISELLVADNGSWDGADIHINRFVQPDVFVQFKKNTGIANSHNILFAQAKGDLIILTGCNRILPKGWGNIFLNYFEKFSSHLMACCIYNDGANAEERYFGDIHHSSGLDLIEGVLMDVICFRREIFRKVGYYDLGFGLYGVEDLEFSARIHRWCKENGKIAGVIPHFRNQHLGFDPAKPFDPEKCSEEYYNLKKMEVEKFKEKEKRFQELAQKNFPFFSPF